MAIVTIEYKGKIVKYQAKDGMTILEALQASGTDVSFPCGGNHTCGKCRVEAHGTLTQMGANEAYLLAGSTANVRLACFAKIVGDCTVKVLPEKKGERILVDFMAGGALDPIYNGGYGIAVDIGTTTVVGYLFAHDSQNPLAVCGEINRQQAFGADVLSRIDYCNHHTVKFLSDLIRKQLSDIAEQLCVKAEIEREAVCCFCVTGNTTMLHLLDGLEPRTLALAPFTPVSLFDCWTDWRFNGFKNAPIYLPPCISSYIGADITCSTLASGIAEKEDTELLVDIGTNGEMVLRTPDHMVCCSTAAGPAFEGAGISSGTSAHSGAINTVGISGDRIVYTTIDDVPAVGICGSGLIDAIYVMHRLGIIDSSGRMGVKYEGSYVIGDSGISLTQADVRAFQLAKGAIRGGMDTLMHECDLKYSELSKIVLCGGFGSYIDTRSAEGIGLIPPGFAEKTIAIGNAAGTGAGQILQSRERLVEAQRIAYEAEAVELSYSKYFTKRYVQCMTFGAV